jgi:DNA modification methylase
LSDAEAPIYENVMRKEREAAEMSENLIENVREFEREEFSNLEMGTFEYRTDTVEGKNWKMMLGDSCERLKEIEGESVHLSIFSPPFQSLYTYSPTERDIGNSKTVQEFFQHFNFIIQELLRITVPGRNCCVHVAQVPAMLVRDGYIGLKDMRGDTINAFEANGWIFHGDVTIDKDPQAQAIRTHSKALLFTQLKKDASWLRPALADYILVFRKPGDNPIPIKPDLTNNEWIEWARPIWYGIKETDTLNFTEARENEDERHICPLQLGTINRCIRLWSNEGETICSPFAGIGSEGYEALNLKRHFIGCELKKSYFDVAVKNLQAVEGYGQQTLFQEAQ